MFCPTPRSFSYSLPKKIAQRALSDALVVKFKQGEIILSQNADSEFKTSYVKKLLTLIR